MTRIRILKTTREGTAIRLLDSCHSNDSWFKIDPCSLNQRCSTNSRFRWVFLLNFFFLRVLCDLLLKTRFEQKVTKDTKIFRFSAKNPGRTGLETRPTIPLPFPTRCQPPSDVASPRISRSRRRARRCRMPAAGCDRPRAWATSLLDNCSTCRIRTISRSSSSSCSNA